MFISAGGKLELITYLRTPHVPRVHLSGQDLTDADLSGCNFSGLECAGANFSGADLSYTNFHAANLYGADFNHANLSRADLSYADLSHANLSHANLNYTNLSGAKMIGTRMLAVSVKTAIIDSINFGLDPLYQGLSRHDMEFLFKRKVLKEIDKTLEEHPEPTFTTRVEIDDKVIIAVVIQKQDNIISYHLMEE